MIYETFYFPIENRPKTCNITKWYRYTYLYFKTISFCANTCDNKCNH